MTKKTSEYIVAYIDMLGTKSRMKNSEKNQLFLNTLYKRFNNIKKQVKDPSSKIDLKFFSDNLVIAKKLVSSQKPQERVSNIRNVLSLASYFQYDSAVCDNGFLVRGAVTIGDFFVEKGSIVYGHALDRVYKLERDIAIYPRIIIDPKELPEFKNNETIRSYISNDFDGIYFLNYLKNMKNQKTPSDNEFEKIKKMGYYDKKDLHDETGVYADKVYQKCSWHTNYVNREQGNSNTNNKPSS